MQQTTAITRFSMKGMYEEQKEKIDKIVVGLGDYQLCQPYKSYRVSSKEWSKKNQKQSERVLQRFPNAELKAVDQVDENDASFEVPADELDQSGPSTISTSTHAQKKKQAGKLFRAHVCVLTSY